MSRKFGGLGVVVVAAIAVVAMSASVAQAKSFTASKYPTEATGTSVVGNDVFETEAGDVECKSHFAVAALAAASETITVTPTYSECKAFGFISATVSMNGCDYVIHSNGNVDIECPTGKAILITAPESMKPVCEATVGTQTGLKSAELENFGEVGISVLASVSEIAFNVTRDGFLCPFGGLGEKIGSYTQEKAVLFTATNGAVIDIG